MRKLVSVSSGFRVAKVTAFWLGMAVCVRSAEPGLRHEPFKFQWLDPGMAVLQILACCFRN